MTAALAPLRLLGCDVCGGYDRVFVHDDLRICAGCTELLHPAERHELRVPTPVLLAVFGAFIALGIVAILVGCFLIPLPCWLLATKVGEQLDRRFL